MVVQHIDDDGQFEAALRSAGATQLVVCDFFAHWCGPCRFIAPIFEQLSNKYPDATFLKIDVDRCRMASQLYGVRAMPTFVALVNRQEVGRISGADPNSLERLIATNIIKPKAGPSVNSVATLEERNFLKKIVEQSKQMEQYEDEIAKTLALSLLSLDDLNAKSTIGGAVNQLEKAKNLMVWFHDEFFEWVDKPNCDSCQAPANSGTRLADPSAEERGDSAGRVELHRCSGCETDIRFPRYQQAIKLLETRRGRCGEWANCFVLFCRAVGFDTRWVTDNADHVWVEIWSDELDRWVHMDPCENVMDTPLMYEKGWGKKYAYVFAFGIDHVRDVTWRYCYNHKAAIRRRKSCREAVLRNFLNKLNARLSKNVFAERRQHLNTVYMKELVEFLSPKLQLRDGKGAELRCRSSGNETWRQQRGELSTSASEPPANKHEAVVIQPTDAEKKAKCIEILYDCVSDEYVRPNNDASAKTRGWQSLCYESENVFRKWESDWKMVYLCRKAGSTSGHITWKVDLSGIKAQKAKINLGSLTTFQTGHIMAVVCCGDSCAMVPEEAGVVTLDNLAGAEYLELRVDFSGGEGDCAWQHAQLFRSNYEQSRCSLSVKILLE